MKKLLTLLSLFIVPVACLFAEVSTPSGWTDDFDAAKKQALKEKKILLVNFTGTDWCKWCMQLEKEVFSQKKFVDGAKKNFVLVFIDIPNNTARLSELGKAQNKKLVDRYLIRSFPTVALMDPSGVIIDRTGYQAGGPEKYLSMLNSTLAGKGDVIKKMRQIHNAKGADKAKKIDAWLSGKSIEEQKIAIDWVNEMLAIDSRGSLGIRKKYTYFTDFLPLSDAINELAGEYFAARREFINSVPAEKKSDSAFVSKKNKEFVGKWKPKFDAMRKRIDALRKKFGKAADEKALANLESKLDFLEGVPAR